MKTNYTEICRLLIEHQTVPTRLVALASNPAANKLVNDLENHPHAYVLACLMDRQQKADKCWVIPYHFQQKLGNFKFDTLARLTQDDTRKLMTQPEPLHRFGEIMAGVFYQGVKHIEARYDGDASRIWKDSPSSAAIVRRFLEFEGAGPKIATMAANILMRSFNIPVSDKISIDISVDVHVRQVFQRLGLIREQASNEEIIYAARELNPLYPGIFDLPLFEIGRTWCSEEPNCEACYMRKLCAYANSRP